MYQTVEPIYPDTCYCVTTTVKIQQVILVLGGEIVIFRNHFLFYATRGHKH